MPALIDTPEALHAALDLLAPHTRIALDTESDSFHAYKPKLCLLQLSVPGHDFLIDPLAELDLAPLGELLGDPNRRVILHAAENDVIQMKHEFGWRIPGLFDTQIACFVLGTPPYSLAGVLEGRFGVKLDKSQQRSDWAARPLSDAQLEYAADDTRYLIELHEELDAKAGEAGRREEIAHECARIAERDWEPEPFDPEGFRRMKGAKELDAYGLRILRGLHLMRHEEAEKRNRPAYRIANDQMLMEIARKKATRGEGQRAQGFWRRYGKRVAGIVRSEKDKPPLPKPKRERTRGTPDAPEVKERYELLRKWRAKAAEERGVESWVVARNELLIKIARAEPAARSDLEGLMAAFRYREYGDAMWGALGG
ncbi:MAG: HRDC domain-containing protein [Planctomycetota bacterium]